MQQPNINPQDVLAAKRLAESNATTNYFLGATRRPWMTNAVTVPSLPAETDVLESRRGRGTAVTSTVLGPAASETVEHDLRAQRQFRPTDTTQSAQSPATRPVAERPNTSHGGSDVTRKGSCDVAESETDARQSSTSQRTRQPDMTSPLPAAEAPQTTAALPGRQIPATDQMQMLVIAATHSLSSFQARIGSLGMIGFHRFSLLKVACLQNDVFYLCAHQIFCTATRNPQWTIENMLGKDQCAGLDLMSLILLPNQDMSAEVLHFFADLPAPFERLIKERVVYRNITGQVAVFLGRFAVGWDLLRQRCFSRKSPPFSGELVDAFGVHSPVLRRVLFNSIHRQLGGASNAKLCEQGLNLFDIEQAQYQARKASQENGQVRSQSAIFAERELLGERYRALWKEANKPTAQNALAEHMVTSGQPRLLPVSIAQNQVASGTLPSQRASATAPCSAGSQQHCDYMQWCPTPDPLLRSQSTNNLRTSTAFANSGTTGASSAARIQQMPGPMNPPNFILQSSPRSADTFPTYPAGPAGQQPAPQQRRGRPPLSSRPVVPHISTSVAQRGGRGGYIGRGGHLGSRSLADHLVTPSPSFFPAPGYEPMQTSTLDPELLMLHQAYLRSPAAEKVNAAGQIVPEVRLYQYLESFAIPPKVIGLESSLLCWDFSTTASTMSRKAVDIAAIDGQTRRQVSDGCLLYRLRSVEVAHSLQTIEAGEWSVKDVSWPPCCFIQINDVDIELRRKLHHGKDLPVDLTPHIREGKNEITIALLRGGERNTAKRYAMAVEIVEVGDQHRVDSAPIMLAADDSLRSITQALAASHATTADNDDEVEVVDSHISIDLIDPFMSTIFDVPARGNACTHRECFDLQTFFQTRKSREKGGPTSPDEWKCPICKKDARPQSLVVDCFLKTVRDSFVTSGASVDARAILIGGDGSWNVKRGGRDTTVTREGSDATVADSPATRGGSVAEKVRGGQNVVITIDDD